MFGDKKYKERPDSADIEYKDSESSFWSDCHVHSQEWWLIINKGIASFHAESKGNPNEHWKVIRNWFDWGDKELLSFVSSVFWVFFFSTKHSRLRNIKTSFFFERKYSVVWNLSQSDSSESIGLGKLKIGQFSRRLDHNIAQVIWFDLWFCCVVRSSWELIGIVVTDFNSKLDKGKNNQ